MIPTVKSCFALMDQYRMLANIREHSLVVARVAELIAATIRKRGEDIDLDLVIGAALLHDIAKTQCLDSRCDHARVGREICLAHDFAEIAEIVGQHVIIREDASGRIGEKEIVYYADKRVNHDRIVSLDDRLAYILDRYARNNEVRRQAILENFDKCLRIEKRMFDLLDFSPDQVAPLVMDGGKWRV